MGLSFGFGGLFNRNWLQEINENQPLEMATGETLVVIDDVLIAAEATQTKTIYTVPAGYNLFITNTNLCINSATNAKKTVQLRVATEVICLLIGGIKEANSSSSAVAVSQSFPIPIKVPTGTVIDHKHQLNSDSAVGFLGYLELS